MLAIFFHHRVTIRVKHGETNIVMIILSLLHRDMYIFILEEFTFYNDVILTFQG